MNNVWQDTFSELWKNFVCQSSNFQVYGFLACWLSGIFMTFQISQFHFLKLQQTVSVKAPKFRLKSICTSPPHVDVGTEHVEVQSAEYMYKLQIVYSNVYCSDLLFRRYSLTIESLGLVANVQQIFILPGLVLVGEETIANSSFSGINVTTDASQTLSLSDFYYDFVTAEIGYNLKLVLEVS
uniref:Uncharacterized protein n=1 Tax=Glossina brevipalpis TaxID=37001 RepID=A0A1A9WMF8_9MUSC